MSQKCDHAVPITWLSLPPSPPQDRLDSKGIPITCTASHPGWTSTNLQGGKFPLGLEKILNPILGMSVERGTLSQLQACVDPDAKPRDFYGPGTDSARQAMAAPLTFCQTVLTPVSVVQG